MQPLIKLYSQFGVKMRKFEVKLTVNNCMNCPFQEIDAYENYYCSVAESDSFTARKTVKENREK